MNPTKTIVDQAEAALRLFFAESREDATRLLEMYGPLVRMFEQDLDAAVEVRHLVLDRFRPAEPPAVPGLDFLAVEQDAQAIVAETLAEPTDWARYAECCTCLVAAGQPCIRMGGRREHEERPTPHPWRSLTEVAPKPEVLTGEVTSPFGPCNGLTLDRRANKCMRFAAEYVEWVDDRYGTRLARLCTPCADELLDPVSRKPLTHGPGGVPVERAS